MANNTNNSRHNNKVVYSLNLMTYIMYETGIQPRLYSDEGLIYAIFPESTEVGRAVNLWKNGSLEVNIHAYLAVYAELRKAITEMRKAG